MLSFSIASNVLCGCSYMYVWMDRWMDGWMDGWIDRVMETMMGRNWDLSEESKCWG
jgi:hypothetical protein